MTFSDFRDFLFGTLRGRLILSVAAVHAVMMALFITDLTIRQRAMLLERQVEEATALSYTLSTSAAGWIVARDISGLQELVESQQRYPELVFAILADENGHIMAHTEKSKTGKFLIDLPGEFRLAVISKTPDLVDVAVPAMLGGKFVGWVRVGIGQKTAGKKLDEITLAGILYALLAILIGSVIAWLMGRRITRRLYAVEDTINEVRAGNNSARCKITGTDEAALLAKEFNGMLDTLSERDAKLVKSEKYLKEAQRLAKIGSWDWDIQTDIIIWSEEYYRIYGFDPAQRPPGYEDHLKAYTPESSARLDAAVKKSMQTGEPYELDLELAGAEPRRWITARIETRRDAQGLIIGLRGTAQDITERKRVEQNIALLSFAMNSVCEAAFLIDKKARFHFVNEESCRILGYTRAELLNLGVPDVDPDFPEELWASHWQELRMKRSMTFEGRHKTKDGRVFPVEVNANYIEYENHSYNLALVRDITERKLAEQERSVHIGFIESLDRIDRAIQGTNDLERMMSDALGAVLSIFECDRAFLLYPCDPFASGWQVPMERNKPEYPGVLALKLEMTMTPEVAETLRILLASEGPVKFGPETPYPLPADVSKQFGFKSLMSMAIYPKTGKPWQFGIHQCSHARVWTACEERLFQEIGRRLGDGLTTLLAYRNLKDSQGKLEEAQRIAHIGYWDRDITGNRITLANESCKIFGISPLELNFSMEGWHERWLTLIHPEDRQRVGQALDEALNGDSRYNVEYRIVRDDNNVRHIHSEANIFRDDAGLPVRMLGMMQDITERKRAEEQILKLNRIYAVLSNINKAIVRIHETKELLNEACRIAVELGKFRMAWIGMVNLQTNKVGVVASNGVSEDYLEKINIDLSDALLSNGPTGIAIKTGRHKTSNSIKDDDSMIPWRDNAMKYDYKSSAAFPLTIFGKVTGVFNIYSNETDFFAEEDINLLDEMAKDISFALEFIENEAERKKNEELLKQSEFRLNEAQLIAHIGNWELDLIKNILIWSDEIYRIFEIDSNKFGASYEAFLNAIHPEDRDAVNETYTASLKNKSPYSIDHRLLFHDGRIKYVHEQCETFYDKDGNPVRSIGIVQDITERKQAEEALKEQYSTLRGIIDSTDALIFSLDTKYCYTSFNHGHASVMKEIYGVEIEIGQSLLDNMTVVEDREKAKCNLDRALAGEQLVEESYSGEKLKPRLYFQISHSPIRAEEDEIIGVAVLSQNITKRKQNEEKIIQSLREKETLIRELYHRTKNTMQVIRGILALQAAELPTNTELQQMVKNTEDRIQAISLVHQMLYKSQDLSQISIKEYLHELSALILQSFGVSTDRILLNTKIDDQHFLIDTAIPFGLIINELMTNSLKYAFPDNRKGMISITLTRGESENIILQYSDNGIGVPDGFDFQNQNTLGLKLIYNIGEMQMLGKVVMQNNNGVSCLIEFPDDLYKARV